MKDILEGLDARQREGVLHMEGPAVLLAGPGAGKTRVLTTRAAHLVRSGVRPESILLLTFTRSSSDGMLKRASGLDERCRFVSGGTYHSLASRIVNEHARVLRKGDERPFTVLDDDESTEILKKAMEPIKGAVKDKNWPRAASIARILSYAANTCSTIESAIQAKAKDKLPYLEPIRQVAKLYREIKIKSGMVDYDDLLLYLAILLENPSTGPAITRRWRYVMCDEHQDANALQTRIITALAREQRNIMIVGDPSQSIYAFRGSAPRTMHAFRDTFADAKIINLDTNYRSTPQIVAVVNAIDRSMSDRFDRTLHSARAPGDRPKILEVIDPAREAAAIADAILAHKADGGEIADHAVLVRSMNSARRIETEFISRGIPYKVRGGVSVDDAAHVKDLLSLARIVENIAHEPAWLRMLGRFPKIGDKAAIDIAARILAATSLADAIEILKDEDRRRRTPLETLAEALKVTALNPSPSGALEAALGVMRPIWKDIWADDWDSRERDLEAVMLIALEHREMSSFLTTITLDRSFSKESRREREQEDEKPVTISTIHSAKGLEFPIVHAPGFIAGSIPSIMARDDPDAEDEEKRVFYVLASRAERSLTFYRAGMKGDGAVTYPSSFEVLISHLCDREKYVGTIHDAAVPVASDARIDLADMLGEIE